MNGFVKDGIPKGKKAFWVTVKFPTWGDNKDQARFRAERIELKHGSLTKTVKGQVLECEPAPELETPEEEGEEK